MQLNGVCAEEQDIFSNAKWGAFERSLCSEKIMFISSPCHLSPLPLNLFVSFVSLVCCGFLILLGFFGVILLSYIFLFLLDYPASWLSLPLVASPVKETQYFSLLLWWGLQFYFIPWNSEDIIKC